MEVHAVTGDTSLRCVACCRLSGELFGSVPVSWAPWPLVHGAWCMAVGCWSLALHTAADEVLSRRTWQCQTLAGHQSVCLTRLELGEERGARPRYLSQPDRSGRATGNPRIHLQAVRSPAYSI